MSHILKLALWLIGLLILAALLAIFFSVFHTSSSSISSISASGSTPQGQQITLDMRERNFSSALAEYASVMNDPTATPEEKAIATYTTTGAQYFMTGNINDLLTNVDQLKQIIVDTDISLQTRVASLDILALTYADGDGDSAVTAEVFNSPPFNQYLVQGQPTLSNLNLYEWSYSLLPTSDAAIHIAKWYADQYVSHPDLSATTTQAYISTAEEYLNYAESQTLQEEQSDPTYFHSASYYLHYQFWEALVVGRLAAQGVTPYTTEYQSEFDQFINFAQTSPQYGGAQTLLNYARFNYAQDLSVTNTAAAKGQLDLLAQALDETPVSATSTGFVRLVMNSYTSPHTEMPIGSTWANIETLSAVSPEFASAIKRITAVAPSPSQGTAAGTN